MFLGKLFKKNKNKKDMQLFYAMQSLDNTNDSVFWADKNCNIVYVNKAACRELGYSREELLKMNIFQIDASQDFKDLLDYNDLAQRIKTGEVTHFKTYHRHRDGHLIPVEIATASVGEGDEEVGASVVRDMRERIRIENELKEAYNHLSFFNKIYQVYTTQMDIDSIINDTPSLLHKQLCLDGIAIYLYDENSDEIIMRNSLGLDEDLKEQLKYLSKYFCINGKTDFDGINFSNAAPKDILDLLGCKEYVDCVFFPIYLEKKLYGGISVLNKSPKLEKSKNSEILSAVCSQISIVVYNIELYKSLNKELKKHKQTAELLIKANKELEKASNLDYLTELWNRRCFLNNIDEKIRKAINENAPLYLLLLDFDHFKEINDKFGHNAGDTTLVEFSKLLKSNIGAKDSITRWGGEEFLILAHDLYGEKAFEYAETIRNLVTSHSFPIVGSITVSIGVAVLKNQDDFDRWLKRADDALYVAKKTRNKVILKS